MAILPLLSKKEDLTIRIARIQKGDVKEKDNIIQEYIPLIIKTITEVTNRYVEVENSEELSIGLEAFNEAIDKYNQQRGSFISFAQLVIKSRITDYVRKISHQPVPSSIEDDEEVCVTNFTENIYLREEIAQFEKRLLEFGIRFDDLINEAPKHIDTRKRAITIGKSIASDEEITQELFHKKMLPISKIAKLCGVTPKVIKGSRKFIIAVFLIQKSEMNALKQYIKDVQEGETGDV